MRRRTFFRNCTTPVLMCPSFTTTSLVPRGFSSGRTISGILEVCPTLIGIKFTYAGSHFSVLQESIQESIKATPQLSYFAAENLLASVMQIGAKGSYSSLVYLIPQVVLELYEKAEGGEWNKELGKNTGHG